MMLCIFRDLKGNNERKALTHLNETLKVYNKVLHRFHEELMKVRRLLYITYIMPYLQGVADFLMHILYILCLCVTSGDRLGHRMILRIRICHLPPIKSIQK